MPSHTESERRKRGRENRSPILDALRRAAIGFGAGVAATPAQAGQAPGLGAAIGAFGGLSETLERAAGVRARREERLLEPIQVERLETARQEARKPFRTAEFERQRTARLERDRQRAAQTTQRDASRARRSASVRGISFNDALRIRQQARKEVQQEQAFLGSFPGDPAFETAVDLRESQLLQSSRRTVGGQRPPAVRPPAPGGGQDDLRNILFR